LVAVESAKFPELVRESRLVLSSLLDREGLLSDRCEAGAFDMAAAMSVPSSSVYLRVDDKGLRMTADTSI
jgi:hypothetical protein